MITGNKVAPFKKFTPPYTGPGKVALRDFELEKSKEAFAKVIIILICAKLNSKFQAMEQMETISKEGFLINNPHLITQCVRGEIYVLVDAVLLISNPVKDPKELKMIASLMETYVEFFVKYLDAVPAHLKDVMKHFNLSLSDAKNY